MAGRTKFVDLSKYPRIDIKSIKMRELNADDTMDSASRALPPDGKEITNHQFGLEMRIQTVSGSIIEVDGKSVEGVCHAYRHWSNRTREFVGEIYDHLNGLAEDERAGFRKALGGGDVVATQSGT